MRRFVITMISGALLLDRHGGAVVAGDAECDTSRVIDSATLAGDTDRLTARTNPYTVGLAALGGFAWVLAFMLWIVLAQVTDYTRYDLNAAADLTAWISLLVVGGLVAIVGAAVIAGVRHELKRG